MKTIFPAFFEELVFICVYKIVFELDNLIRKFCTAINDYKHQSSISVLQNYKKITVQSELVHFQFHKKKLFEILKFCLTSKLLRLTVELQKNELFLNGFNGERRKAKLVRYLLSSE